jgi:hypothetical protein
VIIEIVYTWPSGREEVRYRRPAGSLDAARLVNEVIQLQRKAEDGGYVSPYSYRSVPYSSDVTRSESTDAIAD